jgi:hypothetical protein
VTRPPAGLCDRCRNQTLIHNTRGATFSLCELSKTDTAFPRYPRLPVESCTGFSARGEGEEGGR